MVSHVVIEELDWAQLMASAFLKSQRLAIVYYLNEVFIFLVLMISLFVQLKENVGGIRNVLELKRRVQLQQEVCYVGVVGRVDAVSRLLVVHIHRNK